jgi:ketosteroid isomerase-like protein
MKTGFVVVQLFLLLLTSSLLNGQSAKTETPREDKAEISRLEDRWLKAIETADVATLDSILADDFVRPVPAARRFITKTQLLEYYKSHKQESSAPKHIENLSVTFYGTTAIARGNVVTADPNSHVVSRNLFTDVFVFRGGRWQALSAQENETANH